MGLDMGLNRNGEEVGYWRKANQIREWFVNHLDDFNDEGDTKITEENCEDLLETCKEVLADHDKAPELLPTSIGFFFGSQEYDEYYFEDLADTVEILENVLKSTDWDMDEVVYWESY